MEVWKPIKDYENYSVSSFGCIKRNNKELKFQTSDTGYQYCILSNNGFRRKFKVARLVALTFIPNPENKPQVDHIDRNRSNDVVSNLKWATQSENNLNKNAAKNNKLQELNIRHRPEKNLPFVFDKQIRGVSISKSFKTLDDAIKFRDDYLSKNK